MLTRDQVMVFAVKAKSDDPLDPPELSAISTNNPQFKQILAKIPAFAATELPVLLQGEPGTGKELVARALWALSPRRHRLYNRLNCGALEESLVCSELFGHVRGSFTDARYNRLGKFKLAHQGTLFLDEVADLPLTVQPRLLRAVEQGEIEPVGGDGLTQVDVRVVAASNQDLPELVARGRFRQDLFDRLAVLVLQLPPLRDRGDDVLLLAGDFARKKARRYHRRLEGFTPAALRRLKAHHWPGNVRELKNVITRAVLFSPGGIIREADLHFTAPPATGACGGTGTAAVSGASLTSRPTSRRLEELLGEEGGNVSALSRRLQVCTKTIYRWLKSYRLDLVNIRQGVAGATVAALMLDEVFCFAGPFF